MNREHERVGKFREREIESFEGELERDGERFWENNYFNHIN